MFAHRGENSEAFWTECSDCGLHLLVHLYVSKHVSCALIYYGYKIAFVKRKYKILSLILRIHVSLGRKIYREHNLSALFELCSQKYKVKSEVSHATNRVRSQHTISFASLHANLNTQL